MSHNAADDFDHPGFPEVHPLRRHVLCSIAFKKGDGESVSVGH
jgi:hypothetical protein